MADKQALAKGGEEPGHLTVRFAEPGDATNICELFRRVFKHEMPLALWQWKYARPNSHAVVVLRNDNLVAHYGGVGTDILLEGRPSTAIQVTDLMVDPQARHAIRSLSPFFLSARQFLESFAGYGKPYLLGYGFPSDRAMGLSEKLGLFAPAGRMWETEWTAQVMNGQWPGRITQVDASNFHRHSGKIDRLWRRFSKLFDRHIVGRKDAGYFHWRFLEHPTKKYSLYLLESRFLAKAEVLLVIRHDGDKSMLMDVLATALDLEVVIATARSLAAQSGSNVLHTWSSDVFRDVFAIEGAKQQPLSVIIPANTWTTGPPVEAQRDKWWFMPGDTDYL